MKKRDLVLASIAIILLILAIVWTILVANGLFDNFDKAVVNNIISIRGEKYNFLYWIVRIITEFAYIYFTIFFIIVILIIYHCDLKSIILAFGTLTQLLINTIIKSCIKRPRPDQIYHWMEEASASYPSGHSMTASFLYGFLIYIIIKSNISKTKKIVFSVLSGLIPVLVGISRIILSVHYTSDVIGGFLFGSVLVVVAILICELLSSKFNGLKPFIDRKLKGDKKND